MDDDNLLVSSCSRAPGRARREILARLRALGDEAPTVAPTGVKGLFGVRTSLDPRYAILELRALCERSPRTFRYTFKWIPVDAWTATDFDAMKQAVSGLRDRFEANETWRMTVERRAAGALDPAAVITALAVIIPAKVNRISLGSSEPGRPSLASGVGRWRDIRCADAPPGGGGCLRRPEASARTLPPRSRRVKPPGHPLS